MKITFFITFEDNKIKFKANLPMELHELNEDKFFELDEFSIYECSYFNVNLEILNKNICDFIKEINSSFFNKNYDNNEITYNNYFILDTFNNQNQNIIYNFLKYNKNLNIELPVENYKELIDNLKDEDFPNLKISFKNSYESVSYKEFYSMFSKLNEIITFVKYYNLSPLETIMLIYDIVKANEYKKENENESYGLSRNLNEIVNNDKIVCVGFSNLLDFLLNNLGFDCGTVTLKYEGSKIGHERNYVYLHDDKYNIHSLLFLDATGDSKKIDNYIDNYYFFLKPLFFFKLLRPTEQLRNHTRFDILYNKNKKELFEYIEKKLGENPFKIQIVLNELLKKFDSNISLSQILPGIKPINEEIEILVDKIIRTHYKTISKEDFKNALYKVRRIEYLNKIITFEPNEEYIDSICDRYFKSSVEDRLLELIFGKAENPSLNKDLKEIKAKSVEEDLLRIRMIKAFKTKLDDFPENDYIKKM